MQKKSFVFYVSWREAINKMNESQMRRFIDNLCNYAEGKEIDLQDIVDELMWSQVKPLLDHNETKRQKRIENGRKGGLSKSSKEEQTEANDSNTKQTVANDSVEGRGMKEEGRGMKEEGRGMKEEGRGMKEEVEKDDVYKKLMELTTSDLLTTLNDLIGTEYKDELYRLGPNKIAKKYYGNVIGVLTEDQFSKIFNKIINN